MRRFLFSVAKFAVSAALLYFALRETDFAALGARLTGASVSWLALGIVVCVLQLFVNALRWRAIGGFCEAPLTLAQAMRYAMIGAFFNQTLPSAIGGDAVRLWLAARTGAGFRAATYSVFVDRATGLIGLATVISMTLPWTLTTIGDPDGRIGLLLLDLAALGAGVAFLLLRYVPGDFLARIWATRHFHACSEIFNRVLFDRRSGPMFVATTLIMPVLAVVIAWCVARAIAAPVTYWQLFQLVLPVILVTMIPISVAGWGLREASMGLAFGYAGLAASEGVNVSLLYGAVYFVVGAVGGLIWVFSAEKAAKGDAPIEVPE